MSRESLRRPNPEAAMTKTPTTAQIEAWMTELITRYRTEADPEMRAVLITEIEACRQALSR